MIRIGDFARRAGVSVATLRLYDEQGLLAPASIDPATGYRSYEPEQLQELHRISVLKELGFSLREIHQILRENLRPEGLSERLREKRTEAEALLQVQKQKIKRMQLQIQIIEGLETMTIENVQVITAPELNLAAIHLVISTNDQVGPILGGAYDRLFQTLGEQGVTPTGPCLAVWASSPDEVTNEVVDAAVPVGPDFRAQGDVQVVTLPPTKVATVTHQGDFSNFQTCHIVLKEWLAANRYRLNGAYREIYHSPPGPDSVTEVQYPIEAI